MKIYTRGGDRGETSLLGAHRVSKASLRVEAYGEVDELNAVIGVCHSFLDEGEEKRCWLEKVQEHLFVVGAQLASLEEKTRGGLLPITSKEVELLEKWIDELSQGLVPLRSFILPGGGSLGAFLHLARTVARRAERRCVALRQEGERVEPEIIMYLNRLSDFLFVLARWANARENRCEIEWVPRKGS